MFFKDGVFSEERILSCIEDNGLDLSIAPSGQFRVNGFDIPYEKLQWFFETFGTKTSEWVELEDGVISTTNCIHSVWIDDVEYSMDTRKDISGNWVGFSKSYYSHCVNGPAVINPKGEFHFVDGKLHNLHGPAKKTNGEEVWAINDVVFPNVSDYVESHPFAKIHAQEKDGRLTTVARVCGKAVVRVGKHKFLLEKSNESESKATDFLLACLYKNLKDYKLVKYEAPSTSFHRIFHELNKIESFIIKPVGPYEQGIYGAYGERGVSVKYNRKTDKLSCKIFEYIGKDKYSAKLIEEINVNLSEVDEVGQVGETNLANHKLNRKFAKDKTKIIHDNVRKNLKSKSWIDEQERQRKYESRKKEIDKTTERLIQEWEEKTPVIDMAPILAASNVEKAPEIQTVVVALDDEFKQEFAEKFNNNLDEYLQDFVDSWLDTSNKIYGISIPADAFQAVNHNPADNSFYWTNSNGEFNVFQDNLPSVIFPDGVLFYHLNGLLHRESGPAIEHLYADHDNEYWLWGKQISYEEFKHYDSETKSIEFKNESGKYHRENGPAVTIFNEDGTSTEYFYENGSCIYSIRDVVGVSLEKRVLDNLKSILENDMSRAYKVTPRKPKVRKVTKRKPKVEFTELSKEEVEALRAIFRDHKEHLRKFAPEIHEAARKAILKKNGGKEPEYEEEEEEIEEVPEMVEETAPVEVEKKIRSAPDLSGGRASQIKNGFLFGLKKGFINNGSQLLSQKLVSYTPMEGNEWMERFVQICILVGLAELFKRMPQNIADKIRMSEDARLNLASDLRFTSGENIGRDLVDIAANVMPLFAEVLKGVTTEELEDLATNFEISEEEDEEEAVESDEELFNEGDSIDVGDLFAAAAEETVEEKVHVKQEVEA